VGTPGDLVGDDARSGRSTLHPVVGPITTLVAANVLLVLGAVVGVPAMAVLGSLPILAIDVVVITVVMVLARRGSPPPRDTLLPRRHPGLARVSSGLFVLWAVASIAGDSFWALVAAPAGFFALVMALFRTAAVWWRWCARAAAVSILTWPAPVLAGLHLDRNAIEGWGVGFGSVVATGLVGLTVCLATAAAVGYAIASPAPPAVTARGVAADPG
jgi:hypothetical protein